ncbi:MAG TPA: CvpA family protein [Steroidobacteraceae bacterium]
MYNARRARIERDSSQAMLKSADYWVVAIILVIAIIGLMRGFLREVVAVVSWLLALFIAWHFAAALAPHLGGVLTDEPVRSWAARAILLILVLFVGSVAGIFIGHFVRVAIFSVTDGFLGFALGLVRGAIVLGVLVIICQLLHLDGERWWHESLLIPYVERVANGLRTLVGEQHHDITRV